MEGVGVYVPHRWQVGVQPTMILLFQKFFFLKITKQHTASLISTINTGETNKIKLTNYFILRMRVFIQNFTNIKKGIKCRGKKFT